MSRNILIVEDDRRVAEELAEFLGNRDYTTVVARDGNEAFKLLGSPESQFDAITLDLRMPNLSGEKLLTKIADARMTVAPIIVQSAYFDEEAVGVCLRSGVKCLFRKPIDPDYLDRAIRAIVNNDDSELLSLVNDPQSDIHAITAPSIVLFNLLPEYGAMVRAQDPHTMDAIGTMVSQRESALRSFFIDRTNHGPATPHETAETLLVIARRWNSWYPSFFDVPGGSYLVSSPAVRGQPCASAVIDPGFKFLSVLRDLGVCVQDIGTCVISHNHPDHVAGLFELLASRHALSLRTKGWCNPTTRAMYGDCSGFGLEMDELSKTIVNPLFTYRANGSEHKVMVRGFETAHREMGRVSASLGLVVSCCRADPKGDHLLGRGVILGDTEYDRAYHPWFVDQLTANSVRFVVLHVGSVQQKQRDGGHLYYPGLQRILRDMDAQREKMGETETILPVLLSEWGLEHATTSQIEKIVGRKLQGFDDYSPMLETAEQLNRDSRTLHVVPADIGLAVGLETGRIYLRDGRAGMAEDLIATTNDEGLEYSFR